MKTSARFQRMLLLVGVGVLSGFASARADLSRPVITSVKPTRTNLLVTVDVPAGLRQITIESRAQLGRGSWEPRAVVRTGGEAGTLTVSLDLSRNLEILRVKAGASTPLPADYYSGASSFNGPPSSTQTVRGGDSIYTFADGGSGIEILTPGTTDTGSQNRDVVESDIWKVSGNTLYYFNQNRGLQIIDITHPDQAVVRGVFSLPAVGEQMYLVGSNHVALLARESCSSTGYRGGRVIVVEVSGPAPREVATLPVAGSIRESRMVGSALYVSSAVYRQDLKGTNWVYVYGTQVESFDLSKPEQPAVRDRLWLEGTAEDVVSATDVFLFVSTRDPSNYYRSAVHVIDITSPDGAMSEYTVIRPAGVVKDKFKLNYVNGILTSISEDWNPGGTNRLITRLETWRLPDPRSMGPLGVAKLGQLELGGNEQLHATRFDGNRVYVVTFFRIDPLWVVDLADPTNPRISGELQIPGWSTYIQPLGDRLVAVGVDGSRVAVSLFDVRDPARPALYSKVLLGESYSWSEANNDEKAFTVLPAAGLILVPYSGNTTNGWATRVQLIDLNPTNLVARGIIEHQCQPRRATLANGRILSLSGWEYISVDATDRDHPVVKGTIDLAWPVSRVFVVGDYLLQLSDGQTYYYGQNDTAPVLRVSPANEPDKILQTLKLGNLPVAGVTRRDNHLFVAQASASYYYPIVILEGSDGGSATLPTNFVLSVVDLSKLPELRVIGEQGVATTGSGGGQAWEPVWPSPEVLVWVNSQSYPIFYLDWGMPVIFADGVSIGATRFGFWGGWYPYYWRGGGQMLAFDVRDPAAPTLASTVNLSTNSWFSFSQPFAADNLVFISHGGQWISELLPDGTNWGLRFDQKFYLDVVDFTDPTTPLVRRPVNIPGTLSGITLNGNVIFTQGQHYDGEGKTDYTQWLDASAYDGVSVYLLDSVKLPSAWPNATLVAGGNIFLAEPISDGTNPPASALSWLVLSESGKFAVQSRTAVPYYVSALAAVQQLLATLDSNSSLIQLYDTSGGTFKPAGQGKTVECLWPDLSCADGATDRGFWVPLGSYGVLRVPVGVP